MKLAKSRQRPRGDWVFICTAVVLSLLLGLGLAAWLDNSGIGVFSKYSGLGGDFTLTSSRGDVSLEDFRGRVVVMYFGYGSCPDACPTSLAVIVAAIGKLDTDEKKQVQAIFISVDPQRDTPEFLAQYTQAFYPEMLGLTGHREQIDEVIGQYKAFYALVPQEGTTGGYRVDHTSYTYIIGRDGDLHEIMSHGTTPESLAAEFKKALG